MNLIVEKEYIRLKLAICLNKFLAKNLKKNANKTKTGALKLADGLRQLEASSGISYNVLQTASMGKRDLQITTIIRILEALDVKPAVFFKMYDHLTEEEVSQGKAQIDARSKPRKS